MICINLLLFAFKCAIWCFFVVKICALGITCRVRTGHGKPGKSWNFVISFSRAGKSWILIVGQ